MTQKPNSIRPHAQVLNPRLLAQGLGWLGGLSLLSGGVVFAQTSPTDSLAVPSAQDLLMPAEPAPAPPAAAPVTPAPAAPEPASIERSPAPAAASPAPKPSTDATPIALPSEVMDEIQTLTPESDRVIDNTDYNLGATPGYGQRPAVVLSERSTGCQTTLQQGQSVPASLCALPNSVGGKPTSVSSVSVGPVRLGSNGIGIGRNYYNLTQRPMGMLGNNNTRLIFPLSLPASITSAFGWRVHPISGAMRFHYGTDLGAPMGTPVLAAYSGRVAIADFMNGYGLTVVMRHASPDAQTLYAHLSEIFVQPGEVVEQGQVIGRVGSTGNSTGPHLHFEYRERTQEGWVALNPGGLLEQALATFGGYFQAAQAPAEETQVSVFHLDGIDGLLKALKEDPELVAMVKAQSFEDFPVVFDPNITDLILISLGESTPIELNELKGWSKPEVTSEQAKP
ncbi:M23 family metallopeptidase [Oscillatoria sp. FACHB-1407]|uniref:M23 family metallopeptidase n=1 Tax=Oscillatoria sp. FACHB-1407 TaxID=2692847 RepID=UPI001684FDE7|nr:M23 family metallopeptidase [Oscillatoria sp. FACHB-1407]MBD2462374.1 M23 family metallopeptidase [Oscillatoria sp. FACHB-1407]